MKSDRQFLFKPALVTIAVFAVCWLLWLSGSDSQPRIEESHPSVSHLTSAEFKQVAESDRILFDVREQEEYQVSHLQGAIWVSPAMKAEDFINKYGDLIHDKEAVFYCSVGKRSSEFVEKIQNSNQLAIGESTDLYNLQGGIFAWVNNGEELNGEGVHPYNAYWAKRIEDQSQVRYEPE